MIINLPSSRYFKVSLGRLALWVGLGVAFFQAAGARAADSTNELSLTQAIDEGIGHSPLLAQYRSARDEADWGRSLSRSAFLPQIDLKAEHVLSAQYETLPVTLGSLTAAVPIVSPRSAFGAGASWTLWDGLANIKRYQAAG